MFSSPNNFLRGSCSISVMGIACTYCNTSCFDIATLE